MGGTANGDVYSKSRFVCPRAEKKTFPVRGRGLALRAASRVDGPHARTCARWVDQTESEVPVAVSDAGTTE
jgi:hypothetical protein